MDRIINWGHYPSKIGVDLYLHLGDDGVWSRHQPWLPIMECPDLIVVGQNHLLLGRCIVPYSYLTKGVLESLQRNVKQWFEDPRFGGDKVWLMGFMDALEERLENTKKSD